MGLLDDFTDRHLEQGCLRRRWVYTSQKLRWHDIVFACPFFVAIFGGKIYEDGRHQF
jgi:hypothetical protein